MKLEELRYPANIILLYLRWAKLGHRIGFNQKEVAEALRNQYRLLQGDKDS